MMNEAVGKPAGGQTPHPLKYVVWGLGSVFRESQGLPFSRARGERERERERERVPTSPPKPKP